jgi:hypothetical protein
MGSSQAQDLTQVSTTGNLVNPTPTATTTATTWQNVGLWNQGLPCWAPGGDIYCGPQPYYNQGLFNFSYGVTDVYQNINIAAALPNSGTGLRVTGYNFGFAAKNGNGWDGAGTDTLWAYVRFTDSAGKIAENDVYNLNYQFDWWTFNYSRNFTAPYPTATLSTATIGFVAGDTSNYWAGPYGPEVMNVNFSLKYDVDPCATNPLYSPTCSGFADAMAKITAPAVLPVAEPVIAAPTTTTTVAEPTATTAVVSPLVAATAVTSPVAAAVPSTTPTAARSTTANNSAAVAVAMRAVADTQATVNSVLSQAQESAAASSNTDNNNSNNDSTGGSISGSSTLGSGLTISFGFQMPGAFALPGMAMTLGSSAINTQSPTSISTESSASAGYSGPATVSTDNTSAETSPTSTRALAAMSTPPMSGQEENTAPRGVSTVRSVAPPTELAGGPDIGAMAVAPQGFSAYLTAQIRDAAFYPPREVYRGQRTVDNARALRGLGSDARHAEMVDQQYRK